MTDSDFGFRERCVYDGFYVGLIRERMGKGYGQGEGMEGELVLAGCEFIILGQCFCLLGQGW